MLRRIGSLLLIRPSEAYNKLVNSHTIEKDDNQIKALPIFDRLYDDLVQYADAVDNKSIPPRSTEMRPPNRFGIIPSFFFRRKQERELQSALSEIDGNSEGGFHHPLSQIKGLYVWGSVGCGKTMLMDLLFENCPMNVRKQRIHFHQFMLDVHRTSHNIRYIEPNEERTKENTGYADLLRSQPAHNRYHRRTEKAAIDLYDELAERLVGNVELLCFDEVAVSDVADAMILKRLFQAFYKMGLVVVFTSNRVPENLYLGGLNRGGFLPFIDLVNRQCVVYHMLSHTDHRLSGHQADTYLSPFTAENDVKFEKLFLECCKAMPTEIKKLRVFGREVVIPRACGGVCYFEFHEICGEARSTADYQAIAKTFHTVFINRVPQFPFERTDVKTRFLLLIDSLYERRCKVVIYAAVEPQLLQSSYDGNTHDADTLDPSSPAATLTEGKEQSNTKETTGHQERQYQHSIQGNGNVREHDKEISRHTPLSILTSRSVDQLTEYERETGQQLIDEGDNSFQMQRCISRLSEMRTKEYLESEHHFHEQDHLTQSINSAFCVSAVRATYKRFVPDATYSLLYIQRCRAQPPECPH